MGKKRKMGVARENAPKPLLKKYKNNELESALLDPSDRNYIYDEINEFEDNRDLVSLETAKKLMERRGPSREQVLGIDGSSSDEDEDDEVSKDSEEEEEEDPDQLYMEDDIVDTPEFEMPDERAWGNKKHRYFGTDTADEKIRWNIYNQDEEVAQLEEETARKLQERMAAELKDLVSDDLILQADDEDEKKEPVSEDLVEADVSSLSRSRKLQLLKRESPEFLPLIEDLKSKCEELKCILSPLMEKVGAGKIPDGPVKQYVTTKYRLVLNYVTTISMYMLVKCSAKNARDHPVIGRLAQYRQLLKELEPCDNKLASHLGQILSEAPEEEDKVDNKKKKKDKTSKPKSKPKKLQILKKSKSAKLEEKKRLLALLKEPVQETLVKARGETESVLDNAVDPSSDEEHDGQENSEPDKHALDADEKRAIGYTIAKNKGLTPYRNKDQRNPRVRYRNKYTKKLKRRKTQVQNVRREVSRYEGEITGIKSHTIRSVKIKS